MKHLIVSREFPPAAYAPGGIGTYVANISRLLAERGEVVHVIGERWSGAPAQTEVRCDGRLVIHRIGEDDLPAGVRDPDRRGRELNGLKNSDFPYQWFAWHAALLAEQLIDDEGIDVVEGQEWEAPLYYLMLRRALGMGSKKAPPCIVHLHSATQFIQYYNGVPSTPCNTLMKRMEEYCVRAADGLLCPSRTYADQCARAFDVPRDAIEVIPLPVGSVEPLPREPAVWTSGSICFVGRLEPRKGIVEWVQAAARVAREDRDVRFDFVGADTFNLQATLTRRLDRADRTRFRFHGSKPREELKRHLAAARSAVVPSRWENFPNVCVEAMGSGLPVIATRFGGMVEMIEDGRSGWLARDTGVTGMVDSLAEALRRCLATPPETKASMGLAAAASVRELCDNAATVERHVRFRSDVAARGARKSCALARSPLLPVAARSLAAEARPGGRAGIVVRTSHLMAARDVVASLAAQTAMASVIVLVCTDGSGPANSGPDHTEVLVLDRPDLDGASAWNAGFEAICGIGDLGFCLFLDNHDRLEPRCLERIRSAFEARPDAAILSVWTLQAGKREQLRAPPCAEPAYQLIGPDLTPATAFRAGALGSDPPFRTGMPRGYDLWDLANRLLLDGWSAATLPEALHERTVQDTDLAWPGASALRAIRSELLSRFAGPTTAIALGIIDNHVPLPLAAPFGYDPTALPRWQRRLMTAVRDPGKAVGRILSRAHRLTR